MTAKQKDIWDSGAAIFGTASNILHEIAEKTVLGISPTNLSADTGAKINITIGVDVKLAMSLIIPANSIAAFACELALKALFLISHPDKDKPKHGHDLQKLFGFLPQDIQKEIITNTILIIKKNKKEDCSIQDFHNDLSNAKDAFEGWRYFMESGNSKCHDVERFLEAFKEACICAIQKHKKK